MGNIFRVSHILQIIARYAKWGKYFPHETTCHKYFILKYLLISLVEKLFYLLIASNLLIALEAKTAANNFTWLLFKTLDSIVFPYFNSNILYSVHLFGSRWFFAIDSFWNVLFQTFGYFWKDVPAKLLISLCWHILCQI